MKRFMALGFAALLVVGAGASGDDDEGGPGILDELSPEKLLPKEVTKAIEKQVEEVAPKATPEARQIAVRELQKWAVSAPPEKQRERVREIMKDAPPALREKVEREFQPERPSRGPIRFDSAAFRELQDWDPDRSGRPLSVQLREAAQTSDAVVVELKRQGVELRRDPSGSISYKGPADPRVGKRVVDNLRNVGGVNLDVAVDFLESLDVPGARVADPLVGIDRPIVVSLRALLKERPAKLPIGRVHGFVLGTNDVFLVGTRGEPALDFDSVAVVIRAVFKEGSIPGVSLDPKPDDPAGPQYSRVIGVPERSVVARIMLEADYMMKRIMLGHVRVPSAERAGFRPSFDLRVADLRAGGRGGESCSRYWFFPVRLGDRDVRASHDGSIVIFDTRVQLLTEQMMQASDRLVGTNGEDPIARRAADLFTEAYPLMEKEQPVFRQLHALVDLVTVCRVWRRMGLQAAVLDELAEARTGDVHVPSSYAGLTQTAEVGGWKLTVSGGVETRPRMMRRTFDARDRAQLAALRRAMAGMKGLSMEWSGRLMVTEAKVTDEGVVERLTSTALAHVAAGEHEKALAMFDRARRADPASAEIDRYRATVFAILGRGDEAVAAIRDAVRKDPADPDLREFKIVIEATFGKLTVRPGEDVRRASETMSSCGYGFLASGEVGPAGRCFDKAIELWDENADARIGRAMMRLARGDRDGALQDLMRARRSLRRQSNPARLAQVLAMSAAARVSGVKLSSGEAAAEALAKAAQESAEALEIDADLALARAINVMARAFKGAMSPSVKWAAIAEAADELVGRHPDLAIAYQARAVVHAARGDAEQAVADLTTAIGLDPRDPDGYRLRGAMRMDARDFAGAARDFEAALERLPLDASQRGELEELLRAAKAGGD